MDGFTFDTETQTITSYATGGGGVGVEIPVQLADLDVLHIASKAFEGRQLTSLSFATGSKIQTIGTYAFSATTNLKVSLTLPSIVTIGDCAFGYYYNSNTTEVCGFTEIHITSNEITSVPHMRRATNLTTVTFCDSITSLPSSMFYGRTALTAVYGTDSEGKIDETKNQLPSQLTTIPSSIFYGCTGLTSFDFTGVTAVGDSAFRGCTGLTEISLPDVVTVGSYSFTSCTNVTALSAPNATSIGTYAFQSLTNLPSVDLPMATTLGTYAFGSNSKLETASFPSVETVDNYAFTTCPLLETITFSENLTTLGTYVFYNNYKLETVNFSNTDTHNLSSIGTYCFYGCTVIDLTIPNSVETIEKNCFYSATITTLILNEGLETIGDYAFYYTLLGTSATNGTGVLTIPDSVKSLGEYVFGTARIYTINMGTGVTQIPANAFYSTNYVYNLNLHEDVTYTFSATAFSHGNASGVTTLTFKNKPVLQGADSLPYTLNHLYLPYQSSDDENPADYQWLSTYGVYNVANTKVYYSDTILVDHFNESEAKVGYFLFNTDTLTLQRYVATTNYNTLTIPEYFSDEKGTEYQAKIIKDRMLYGTSSYVKTVNIPSTTEVVDNQAFSYTDQYNYYSNMFSGTHTTAVTVINVDQSMENIPLVTTEYTTPNITINWNDQGNENGFIYSVFPNSKNVVIYSYSGEATQLDLHDFNEYVGNIAGDYVVIEIRPSAFRSNTALTSLIIPDTVRTIGTEAFYGCTNLEVLTLPAEVDFFGTNVLRELNSVKELRVPEGVTYLGEYELHNCKAIEEIYFPSTMTGMHNYCLRYMNIPDADEIYTRAYFERLSTSSFTHYYYTGTVMYSNYIWQHDYVFNTTNNELIKYILPRDTQWSDHHVIPTQFTDDTRTLYQPTSLGASLHVSAGFKTVDIPSTVTNIGNYCFRYSALESVTLGENVASMGQNVFEACLSLKSADLSQAKFTSLPSSTFSGCTALTALTLQDVCTSVGNYALYKLTALEVLDLSNTKITSGVRYTNTAATDSYYYYLNGSEYCMPALKELTLPSTMTSICLDGNQNITYLDMAHTKITAMSFDNTNITTLILPNSLITIPNYAFKDMESLTELYIPEGVTTVNMYAFDNTGLSNIILPNSVKTINKIAIADEELEEINDLTNVGDTHDFILSASNGFYTIHETFTITLMPDAPSITGIDFAITLAEAKNFTESLFRANSGVIAQENPDDTDMALVSSIPVLVEAEDISNIQNAKAVGDIFGVTVSASIGTLTTEMTIYVTIKPEPPIITSEDVVITAAELSALTSNNSTDTVKDDLLRDHIKLYAALYDGPVYTAHAEINDGVLDNLKKLTTSNPITVGYRDGVDLQRKRLYPHQRGIPIGDRRPVD